MRSVWCRILAAGTVLGGLWTITPVLGQPLGDPAKPLEDPAKPLEDPTKECAGTDPEARIKGCTQLITEGELLDASLAGVYSNRGAAYGDMGNRQRL